MSLQSARRRGGGSTPWFAALALLAGLAACNPIEGYRSARGVDKNDPDPNTAPFNQSLAKGLEQPYPNLASVPPPPSIVSTAAERKTLTETLTAERTSTEAPDVLGKPGSAASGPVPPMPPLPPAVEAPAPPPEAAAQAPAPAAAPGKRPERVARNMNEPPEATGPVEAMGQSPSVPVVPNAEVPKPPPPTASLTPAAAPVAPAVALPPAAMASARPEPPPPVPVLPEPQVSPAAVAKPPPKAPPAGTTVATLDLPAGAPGLGGDDRARLDPVLAAYRQKPAAVRIVAYAAASGSGAEQLNNFRAALDRAQSVAKALTDAGIPADKIRTEATPAEAAVPAGRVEVRLLP